VSVYRNGEQVVTIETNCLSGRDISAEDAEVIRMSARHLMAFVGDTELLHLRAEVEHLKAERDNLRAFAEDALNRSADANIAKLNAEAALTADGDRTLVLQAVLDAIKGTLDPSTQIADHPNVKFAQMQRLKWEAQAGIAPRVRRQEP
jgi:hypothetical protein